MSGQIIARIRKANDAEIRVTLKEYKGRAVVDVRVWYVPAGVPDYVATKKGLTFDVDKLPELADALAQAVKLANVG